MHPGIIGMFWVGLVAPNGQRLFSSVASSSVGVAGACRRWLMRMQRPSALQLIPMLSLESNELGYMPPTTRRTGGNGSLLEFTLEGKRKRPESVQLVRCGDFYETYGIDAVMLVNYCGLNPMAGRPRAGCRKDQLQMVLDSLTEKGFSAAVYEEANESDFTKGPERKRKGKQRYLSQLVSPANPNYISGGMAAQNTLANSEDLSIRDEERPAAPRVGLYQELVEGTKAYTLVQIWLESREYCISSGLTPEGVMGLLSEASAWYKSTALPLMVPADLNTAKLDWLPVEADSEQLPSASAFTVSLESLECGQGSFLEVVLQKVAEEAASPLEGSLSEMAFRAVEGTRRTSEGVTSHGGLAPPYADAANCIGISTGDRRQIRDNNDPFGRGSVDASGGVPNVIHSLLPSTAPAHTLRFARRWLLRPPAGVYVDDMRYSLLFLRTMRRPLPQLKPTNVARMVQYLQSSTANVLLLRDIYDCSTAVVESYDILLAEEPEVVEALSRIVGAESGCDVGSMRKGCVDAIEAIRNVMFVDGEEGPAGGESSLLPEGFIQRNESGFMGAVKVDCTEVEEAREGLVGAMASEWPLDFATSAAVFESSCNTVALRRRPREGGRGAAAFYHPKIGRGRGRSEAASKYWTTKGVETASVRYVTACDKAASRSRRMLRDLCGELSGRLGALIAASHWCVVLTFGYLHTENSLRRGWNMVRLVEGNSGVEMDLKGLKPYWMEGPPRGTARLNDFSLDRRSLALLTGCNESGKSTFLRSVCAAALTANTGLFSPCAEGSRMSRLTDLLVMFPRGDRPSDQLSAHALECATLKVVDRDVSRSGAKALVLVDEFGRATSPLDGAALTASQLERFVSDGVACLWATHLQTEVLRVLPKEVRGSIAKWRMRVEEVPAGDGDPCPSRRLTYKIEPGVCSNSMGIFTASKAGLPAAMVHRAMQLRGVLEGEEMDEDWSPLSVEKEQEIDLKAAILAVSSQGHLESLLHLTTPESMPPPLYQASPVVYVLELTSVAVSLGRRYYVGETENLSQRLEQHRTRFEGDYVISGVDCVLARGRGEARSIETSLIRFLQGKGVALVSARDGAHRSSAIPVLNGDG